METITIKSYDEHELEKLAISKDGAGLKLPDESYFSKNMKKFCGKTISVIDADKYDDVYTWTDGDGWFFSELMVETKSDNFKLIYDILNS